MVTTSGFASTPVSRLLIFSIVINSLAVSVLDIKHLLPIKTTPHLWPYLQLSRIFTFQLAYISSTELLFAVVTFYHMRILERLWGSRKFGSFVVTTWFLCGVAVVCLGVVLKAITWGRWDYIPPGPTGVLFALLAVWTGEVPRLYGVRVMTGLGSRPQTQTRSDRPTNVGTQSGDTQESREQTNGMGAAGRREYEANAEKGLEFSDKFTTYLLGTQLALSQFPHQLLPALVGWIVGVAWREELLPMGMIRWRIPGWMVGEANAAKRGRGRYEGLRRRLEEEEDGARDGMREVSDGAAVSEDQNQQRRGFGRGIASYFTGS